MSLFRQCDGSSGRRGRAHPQNEELFHTRVSAFAGTDFQLRLDEQYDEDARTIETQQANCKMGDLEKRQRCFRKKAAFVL